MLSRNATRDVEPRDAAKCGKARYTEVANGIAIVDACYMQNVNGCLRQRPTKQTLADTLSLVDGEKPTFVSYACRHQHTKRQQLAHRKRSLLRANGLPVPPLKCAERLRLESDGGILVMDGYLNSHEDCSVSQTSAAYRENFKSRPPQPDRSAPVRQRFSRVTKYLVDEAILGHRPIFERVPTSEVYGEGCDYLSSVEVIADAQTITVYNPLSSDNGAVPSEVTSTSSVGGASAMDVSDLWSPISKVQSVEDVQTLERAAVEYCV